MSNPVQKIPVSDASTIKEASIGLFQEETFIDDVSEYILADDEEKIEIIELYRKNGRKASKFIESSSFPYFSEMIINAHLEVMDRIDFHNESLRISGDNTGYITITKKVNMGRKMVELRSLLLEAVKHPAVFIARINNNTNNEQVTE